MKNNKIESLVRPVFFAVIAFFAIVIGLAHATPTLAAPQSPSYNCIDIPEHQSAQLQGCTIGGDIEVLDPDTGLWIPHFANENGTGTLTRIDDMLMTVYASNGPVGVSNRDVYEAANEMLNDGCGSSTGCDKVKIWFNTESEPREVLSDPPITSNAYTTTIKVIDIDRHSITITTDGKINFIPDIRDMGIQPYELVTGTYQINTDQIRNFKFTKTNENQHAIIIDNSDNWDIQYPLCGLAFRTPACDGDEWDGEFVWAGTTVVFGSTYWDHIVITTSQDITITFYSIAFGIEVTTTHSGVYTYNITGIGYLNIESQNGKPIRFIDESLHYYNPEGNIITRNPAPLLMAYDPMYPWKPGQLVTLTIKYGDWDDPFFDHRIMLLSQTDMYGYYEPRIVNWTNSSISFIVPPTAPGGGYNLTILRGGTASPKYSIKILYALYMPRASR